MAPIALIDVGSLSDAPNGIATGSDKVGLGFLD